MKRLMTFELVPRVFSRHRFGVLVNKRCTATGYYIVRSLEKNYYILTCERVFLKRNRKKVSTTACTTADSKFASFLPGNRSDFKKKTEENKKGRPILGCSAHDNQELKVRRMENIHVF